MTTPAFGTFEKLKDIDGWSGFIACSFDRGFYKNARCHLQERTGGLQKSVQRRKQLCGDNALKNPQSEMGNRQGLLDVEAKFGQPVANGPGVEIKIQFNEFHGLQSKRIPALPARQVSQNGFKIKLVRKFKDEDGSGPQHIPYLGQCLGSIGHVMQGADHRGRIK